MSRSEKNFEEKLEMEKTNEISDENESLMILCGNKKPKTSLVSLDSTHKKSKSQKCAICDLTISLKTNLKQHIKSVHEGKKPHKCSICDYSGSRKAALTKHIQSVHEGKKPHKCSICD